MECEDKRMLWMTSYCEALILQTGLESITMADVQHVDAKSDTSSEQVANLPNQQKIGKIIKINKLN